MSTVAQVQTKAKASANLASVTVRAQSGLLLRKCACGESAGLDGECEECREKKLTMQRKGINGAEPPAVPPSQGQPSNSGGAQKGAGHNISQIRVSPAPQEKMQAKLTVNEPGDKYEQEADRVAEQVMRMAAPEDSKEVQPAGPTQDLYIQRLDLAGEKKHKHGEEEEKVKESLLTKKFANEAPAPGVPPELQTRIDSIRGGGQPLPAATRAFMEPRFGHDFRQVRVHTDDRAAETARAVKALAYTVGRDVVFGTGQYAPETATGKRLLAHELTHVVQQGNASTDGLYRKASDAPTVAQSQPQPQTQSQAQVPVTQAQKTISAQLREEAKADALTIRDLLRDTNWLGKLSSEHQTKIMAIAEKWANKPPTGLKLSPFDFFLAGLRSVIFEIGHVIKEYTSSFDRMFHLMDGDRVTQFKQMMQAHANVFKNEKAIDEVKFEITKEDVIEGVELAADVAAATAELAAAGVTGGASELIILVSWLADALPKLYNSAKAIIGFVDTIRNTRLDDIKQLFSAGGIGNLLVRALFGEVQSLPSAETEEKSEETEKEPEGGKGEKGLVKLLNTITRVMKALKRAYGKFAGFVNKVLSSINITNQKWFESFSIAYASMVQLAQAVTDPEAVFDEAAGKLREVVGGFFKGIKTKVGEVVETIKARVQAITSPAQLLKTLADKAVEWVLNFIITNPPSRLFKLFARVVEKISGKSLVELLREKVKFADDIIKKIAESGPVQKIIAPLKEPVSRITGAIESAAGDVGSVVNNLESRTEAFMSNGVQMVKELTGINPNQPGAEVGAKAEETPPAQEKTQGQAEGTPQGQFESPGDFLGIIKHGIHSRLMAIGQRNLLARGKALGTAVLEKGKVLGKAALQKGKEKIKGLLLGPKLDFEARGEHHELWVEDRNGRIVTLVASDEQTIQEKIEAYTYALEDLKDLKEKNHAHSLINSLQKLNGQIILAGDKKSSTREQLKPQMAQLVKQLEEMMPLKKRYKEGSKSPKAKEDVRVNPTTGQVVITSKIGSAVPRGDYEELLPLGKDVNLPGWVRAHLVGPGTGKEFSAGIMYAPPEYNSSLAKMIEIRMQELNKELENRKAASPKDRHVEFWQRCIATPFDRSTRRLKEAQYEIFTDSGNTLMFITLIIDHPTPQRPVPKVLVEVKPVGIVSEVI